MNALGLRFLATIVGATLVAAGSASAQYYPSGHVDHHDHVVRDSHGHVVGRSHHDVYHPDAVYAAPSTQSPTYGPHQRHSTPATPYHPHPAAHTVQRPALPQFGAYSHVDELATRLESLTSELLLDLHFNYSHNPGFQETYREAYAIFETAKYVHAAEHSQDRAAIAARLGGLDAEFHHIQSDVRSWSRHHHRQVGQLGILTKMDMIEEAIHHLMTDVGVQPNAATGQPPYPTGQSPPSPTGGPPGAPPFGAAPPSFPGPPAPPTPNPRSSVPSQSPAPAAGATYAPASSAPQAPAPTVVTSPPPSFR